MTCLLSFSIVALHTVLKGCSSVDILIESIFFCSDYIHQAILRLPNISCCLFFRSFVGNIIEALPGALELWEKSHLFQGNRGTQA